MTTPANTASATGNARRNQTRQLGWLAAIFFAVAVLVLNAGGIGNFDDRIGDLLLKRDAQGRPTPQDIVLIALDQKSLDDPTMLEMAGRWPWPRAIHGELLDYLASQKPKVVIFDVIFSEPDTFRPDSDQVFAEALGRTPALLPLIITADGVGSRLADLPASLGIRRGPLAEDNAKLPLIAPKALPPAVWNTGIINFLEDADGIGRRYWVNRPHEGWRVASLAARAVEQVGRAPAAQLESIRLHWYGDNFPRLSYVDVYLDSQREAPKSPLSLTDKIVIIGASAAGLHDLRPTPLSGTTLGPEILATAIANLLRDDHLQALPVGYSIALLALMLAFSTALLAAHRNPGWIGAGLLVLTVSSVATSAALLAGNLLWLPFSALALGWLHFLLAAIHAHLQERKQREHAIQMFGRFLDPNVVKSLTSEGQMATAQAGASQEITILFSDIRGFTTLSESRPPEEIVRLLNRYFDLQVEAVFKHQGTLDKFIGDAIMAFWGAPVPRANHAAMAVRAALDMEQQLLVFKAEIGNLGDSFDIGIGVHTGQAVVGFLGSSQRLDYTAIGDTINLGSRIEGQTKGISRILVSEATRDACLATEPGSFDFIDHGEFHVKGREKGVRLYEPKLKEGNTP